MGHSSLTFSVETLDSYRHGPHRLGEFRTLPVAVAAAKHALDDERVTLAVVRDREGVMVFAVDRIREWTGE